MICQTEGRLLVGVLAIFRLLQPLQADDWPQWPGPKRDGIWRERGILASFPPEGPKVLWRTEIGAGYAGPAVAKSRVYLLDRQLAPGAANPSNPFERSMIPGTERVLCLDAETGKILWKHQYECPYSVSYPAGPRATPVIDAGKIYTLGAEGDLLCLDAGSGRLIWSHQLKNEYSGKTPMWGFAGHPLIDGAKLICLAGGDGSTVVAFDKKTGTELWKGLSAKEPGYCPPVIYEFGGRRQLIIWHPEAVDSLDPETGAIYWSYALRPSVRSGMTIATPRQSGDCLFLSSFYNGSLMLKVKGASAAELIWRSNKVSEKDTDGLHTVMSTPFLDEGYIYGVCSYGQFRCLKSATGERVWADLAPTGGKEQRWGNVFLVRNEERYFLFNEQGDLIIARLSPSGYEEISRAHILEPTNPDPRRLVVWSHPAFANKKVYLRNDKEIVCISMAEGQGR